MIFLSRAAFFLLFFVSTVIAGVCWVDFCAAMEKIDINSASLEELIQIRHIGEVRAKELISLRPFSSLDDIAKIKGIGEARVKDIKEEGLAWVGPSQPQPKSRKGEKSSLDPDFDPANGDSPRTEEKEKSQTLREAELQENQPLDQSFATVNKQIPKTLYSLRVLLIALGLAFFSGFIVVLLKKKIT